jgi:autotransporter-associated beta strand protein
MKTLCTRNLFLTGGLLLMAGAMNIQAANVTKLNTTTMVNGAADWSSAPATTDVGEFGSTPTAGTLAAMTLGGPLTLGGLQLDGTTAGPLAITDANTLTLGTAGINMLTANNNATLNFPLALGGSQTWSVGSGRTLTAGGIVSDGGNVFSLTKTGNGTLTLTNNNTYTGGTTNNGGTLNLDFTAGAANDIILNSSALALGRSECH